MKQTIHTWEYMAAKAMQLQNKKPNILLTIMSSSFVISRGGTKAHFEGKIPDV
jgi:hypothetical protein